MNPVIQQLVTIGLVFGIIQAVKYFNLQDPEYLMTIRYVYAASNIIIFIILYYTKTIIDGTKSSTKIKITPPPQPFK
jgi:hypothetical protein